MHPIPIHIYFEVLAFITSAVSWRKLRFSKLRWFFPFLLFIVGVELSGRYIKRVLHENNAWLYNISVPVEYLFYAFIFLIHYRIRFSKKTALAFIIGFTLYVFVINFSKGLKIQFHSSFLLYGSLFMLFFSCLYFYELLRVQEKLILLKEPMFWIVSGIFLFNAGEFFYNLFFDLLRKNNFDRELKLFSAINNKLIWVLYTCFSIAFLWVNRHSRKV